MPRLTIEGDSVIDSVTGAVVTMGEYTYDRDGAYCNATYTVAGRAFVFRLWYDQYRPDLVFGKPARWDTGAELSGSEMAQAKEVILLALRKRRLDPLWDPPYFDSRRVNNDVEGSYDAEWKRVEQLRKKLYPRRSMWQKWQDTKV